MMTTLAALFGALPLALEHGAGSGLHFPLGITIIGGLLLSQLLAPLYDAGDLSHLGPAAGAMSVAEPPLTLAGHLAD